MAVGGKQICVRLNTLEAHSKKGGLRIALKPPLVCSPNSLTPQRQQAVDTEFCSRARTDLPLTTVERTEPHCNPGFIAPPTSVLLLIWWEAAEKRTESKKISRRCE